MARRQAWHRVALAAAGALAFAASGVSAQEGPSATGVVSASATIAAPVAIQAPSGLSVVEGAEGFALEGTLEVRSPAPHVVSANARAWSRGDASQFSPVRRGSWRGTPQAVRVDLESGVGDGPVRVTYVVAVIL